MKVLGLALKVVRLDSKRKRLPGIGVESKNLSCNLKDIIYNECLSGWATLNQITLTELAGASQRGGEKIVKIRQKLYKYGERLTLIYNKQAWMQRRVIKIF